MHTRLCTIALCTAASALTALPAWAQDADAFGQRFVELMTASGIELAYGSATSDGDTIVLSDFTIAPVGEDPIDLPGDLTFTGVVEGEDGSFTAETATIEDLDFSPAPEDDGPAVTVSMANFLIEDIRLPAAYTPGDISGLLFYRHASVGPIAVSVEGEEVFMLESFVADTEADEPLTTLTSSYAISGIMIDLDRMVEMAETEEEVAEAEEAREVFEAFEIEQLRADFSGSGSWSPDTGDVVVDELRFDLPELGSLVIAGELTGYTGELYAEIMKTQQKVLVAGEDLTDDEAEAIEAAMIELSSDIGIVSASVRYEDASFFTKALAFAAAEQGVDAATLGAGLQFMVPMMMTEVQDAALSSAVSGAVTSFVDDPQSFTIALSPAETVYISDLIAAAEANPFDLISQLGLTVTAND